MPLLTVAGISKQESADFALKDISFTQKRFQNIAIAGETGSGKSTLMKIIAGLVQPDKGQVLIQGEQVKGPEEKLVAGHPLIAYLSQQFELPQFLRVEQVLAYANTLREDEANALYQICQINHLLKRSTSQLSGGERQRIALARLLSTSPLLLLLDEPFSNLDMMHKHILKAVIRDIGKQLRITCMMVSHDPLDTLSWADQILILKSGSMLQWGSPEQIYRQPVNEYAAALFGKYNLIPAARAKALFGPLAGITPETKQLLIRPEDISLETAAMGALEGKVKRAIFFGSHYEVEVLLEKISLTVRTGRDGLKKGDKVRVVIDPERAFLL